jgi:uncharacterized membrane protein YfcA
MIGHLLPLIVAVFLLAGFVKGILGLGLPTVAIGLLATRMSPAQALAIVIVPAILTNIWQTFGGPYLRNILRRLWPMLAGLLVGIWLGAGLMVEPYSRYGTLVLGVLLVLYGIVGLRKVQFHVPRRSEGRIGAVVGIVTGILAAATGVQVIPATPFMQAIGLEKDELVQALGVFFTTSTVALGFGLADAGLLNVSMAVPGLVALAAAFAGMFIGQLVRTRMDASTFRRWFLIGMVVLGAYLAGEALLKQFA